MELQDLAEQIGDIKNRIAQCVEGAVADKYDERAFAFIAERLSEMEQECRSGRLKPPDKRWPELARIAVETDPAVLPPDLGGQLIRVERIYIESSAASLRSGRNQTDCLQRTAKKGAPIPVKREPFGTVAIRRNGDL